MEPVLLGRTCVVCGGKEVTSYCGKCKSVFYCNKDCRRKDETHDLYCVSVNKIQTSFGGDILTPQNNDQQIRLLSNRLSVDKMKNSFAKEKPLDIADVVENASTRENNNFNTLFTSLMSTLSTPSYFDRRVAESTYESDRPNLETMKKKKIERLKRLNKLKERTKPLLLLIDQGSREAIIEAHEIKKELMLLTIENDCDMLLMEDFDTRVRECIDIKMNLQIVVTQDDVTEPPSISSFAKELAKVCLGTS